ncbi:membrane lipoprotein lipid attachment site-containing protein [Flavobacterium sp. DG1-102-2]|uniref:membrane lipoprotein lipid attachment site-containing protein n=1 Tax=Flavobacterium sp. DG1-102-2 TaxID=3081663 RepID=UPI00294A6CCB|nr:membrane lipoprotein lipid attachment site-containing protein [Flavobacterium sp. DG1-102-2]MDV6167493.1 membrane lipoprotein lipid attachment site-containing protein [Flavobacterium sp. DG1-102-2]
MKRIIYLLGVMLIVSGCNIAAGSYPYAEIYEINSKESDLEEKIKVFKEQNSVFEVPKQVGLIDSRSDYKDDLWYHVYFYFKDTDQIIYTWLRTSEENTTSFGLVSVNQGLQLGNWKTINDDLSDEEDRLIKDKFEKLILNKLK